jgi:hypothetical protein
MAQIHGTREPRADLLLSSLAPFLGVRVALPCQHGGEPGTVRRREVPQCRGERFEVILAAKCAGFCAARTGEMRIPRVFVGRFDSHTLPCKHCRRKLRRYGSQTGSRTVSQRAPLPIVPWRSWPDRSRTRTGTAAGVKARSTRSASSRSK